MTIKGFPLVRQLIADEYQRRLFDARHTNNPTLSESEFRKARQWRIEVLRELEAAEA